MSLPKVFWDDDVERLADGFRLGKAENSFGALVPKNDLAGRIGVNDGISGFLSKRSAETVEIEAYGVAS